MKTKSKTETVVTKIITSEDEKYTLELIKEFKDFKGKTAIVIMLYPGTSYNAILKCDATSQAIINHSKDLEISRLRMINLFSKVCQARMSVRNLKIDSDNLDYIEQMMKEEDAESFLWIIAWGSSLCSSNVTQKSKQTIFELFQKHLPKVKIKQFMVDNIDVQSENGIHPLFLKIRYNQSSWFLLDYELPKDTKAVLEMKEEINTTNQTQKEQPVKLSDKIKHKGNKKLL